MQTYIHILTYYGICVHEYTHAEILLNSFGIPRETQDFQINFLIDGTQIKDALFIAETFNSYFTNLGLTCIGRKNPHSPKSYDVFMPHPPHCSFGVLSTFFLEIILDDSKKILKNFK